MADNPNDQVKVYPPDRSLHEKIGKANLDQILSPATVTNAQKTIQSASDEFWQESLKHLGEIGQAYKGLVENIDNPAKYLQTISTEAFETKTAAGLGGYNLVSLLAKSLHKQCEALKNKSIAPKNLQIIKWHFETIRQLLSGKVQGDGGMAGVSIAAELERLMATIK